ncbi:MAG: hypothetical protein RQ767_03380, partial [Thermovirgaceae bacterium]|nr:hypothetical protein [Thermovirgaceae bacterium]
MKLERITIQRMPGINDKFTLDGFANGLNLVVGSNGSGKTTVCRAVRAMLWPDLPGPDPVSVEAVWEDRTATWLSVREGKQSGWQKDGSDSPGPLLPGTRTAHCYTLGLRDLLLSESPTDDEIAREILTRMAGGFNIRKIRDDLFSLPKRPGKSEADVLRNSRERVNTIQEAQKELLSEELSLEELEVQRQEAASAGAKITLLGHAAQYAASKAELTGLVVTLETFPPGMDKIRGYELERLEEIQGEIELTEKQAEDSRRRIEDYDDEIRSAELPEGGVDEVEINAAIDGARSLKERFRDLAEARVNLDGLVSKRDGAERALRTAGLQFDPEVTPDTGPEAMADVDNFLREASTVRAEKEAFSTERRLLSGDQVEGRRALCEQGIAALRKWMAAKATFDQHTVGKKAVWPGIFLALGGAVAAFFGYQTSEPLLLAAGALAGGAGLALLLIPRLKPSKDSDAEGRYRKEYLETGLPEPLEWEQGPVQDRLNELTIVWQRAAFAEEKATQLERLIALEQRTDERLEELAIFRGSLCQRIGIDPQVTDLDLYLLAVRIKGYLDTDAAVKEADAQIESLSAEVDETLASLNSRLREMGFPEAAGTDGILAAAEDIKSRNTSLKQATQGKKNERSVLKGFQDTVERLGKKSEVIYTSAGLAVGDDDGLRERVSRREGYKEAADRKIELMRKMAELEANLAGQEELLELEAEVVEIRRQEAAELSGTLSDVSETIGRIQQKVRDARQGSELEIALAAAEAASDALSTRREETLVKMAGDFLLGKIMDEYEYEARPPVLDRTSRLFERFTAHQYEVFLDAEDADKPRFRARETVTGRGKALSELSDATRMQLLLAARLAYIEEVEEGLKLPLFLDEVLTTTDPERFAAISESLLVMAEEGRQVFYLGANPTDALWWAQTLRSKGLEPLVPINLNRIRGAGKVVTVPAELVLPETERVPEPGTMSA